VAACDRGCNTRLDVQRSEKLLDVDQPRLDLDNERDPELGMEGEQIDPPALAIVVEARLRDNQPTQSLKRLLDRVLEHRMAGIQEAVQLRAAPTNVPPKSTTACKHDSLNNAYEEEASNAILKSGHG
jgi:hypothetical protein